MSRVTGTPHFTFGLRGRTSWQERILCTREDAPLFQQGAYPDETKQEWQERLTAAQRICWSCPVAQQCLLDALATGAWGEIRGGFAILERDNSSRKSYVVPPGDLKWCPYRDSAAADDEEAEAPPEDPVDAELAGAVA